MDEHDQRTRSRLGTTLRGKYHLDSVLGIGGMAAVYAATHRNGKRFAIKMLHAEYAARDDIRKRFVREGYVANAVEHAGAVSVLDDDIADDGASFLVMELLDGESLDELWKRRARKLEAPIVLEIARQLLAVLGSAHARSIVHRDIKPANLFVLRDGTVKVLDFGIARVRDTTAADANVTGTGAVLGTPAYMAPEQALADHDRIDARTDLWAVGATLFALLAGRLVHEATNPSMLLVKAATERARPIAEAVPGLDPGVAAVIDRALEVEPGDRWPDAAAMTAAIDALELASRDALVALAAPRARRPSVGETALGATRPSLDPALDPALEPTGASVPVTAPTVASAAVARPVTAPTARERRHGTTTGVELVERASAAHADATSRSRYLAFGLAAALAIGGGVLLLHRHGAAPVSAAASVPPPPAAETGQASVLVSFVNQTPDPMLDATPDAVFASALYRSPLVQPYADALLRALSTELGADGSQASIAKLLHARGARVVTVAGTVRAKGRGYAVAITATDVATGRVVVERTREAASAQQIVPALGELAGELVHALGGPAAATAGTGMSDQLEADHEFVMAKALAAAGSYQDAGTHAEHAIALDAGFAQPHALLGNLYWNLGRLGDADRELKLALRSIDRMSEHDKLKFLGDYYGITGEPDRSIAALQELVGKWPADYTAEGNLALIYAEKGDVAHALELGARIAKAHPSAIHPRINIAVFEVLAGHFADAARDASSVIADFPHPPEEAYVYLGVAQHGLGKDADAEAALHALEPIDASQAAAARADLLLATGKLAEATDVLEHAAADDDAHGNHDAATRKAALLAEAWLRRGDKARALAAAERASGSAVSSTRFMAARVLIAAGQSAKALALADKLADDLGLDARVYGKLVQGEVALAQGKARDAVTMLEDAAKLGNGWLVHDALGRAYLARDAFAEAYSEFEACLSRTGEASIAFGDDLSMPTTRYLAATRYYLARARDGLGSPDAAAAYREFLAQPADPKDSLVADAKLRLARLAH